MNQQPLFILLGSNMGQSKALLQQATQLLQQQIGPLAQSSSFYKTAAWGLTDQPDFLNQIIVLTTNLPAQTCIQTILAIEQEMGRIRTIPNAPRVIDIDILLYGNAIIQQPNLQIPHPRMALRRFVLIPMNELNPQLVHPITHQTMQQMLAQCPDTLNVEKC